jgi:hypothetical protein
MAATASLYNHTLKRFASGENAEGDTYRVALYSAATFNAADTTLAEITKTEIAAVNGYIAGGVALTNLVVTVFAGSGARVDADNASWSADGGPIAASYAILYNDTDANDPPLLFIDFDGEETAGDGTDFLVVWGDDGIINWEVKVV